MIEDEGMPIYAESRYGDLYVEYNVVLPQTLSSAVQRSKSDCCLFVCAQLTTIAELAEVFHGHDHGVKDEL